MSKYITLCALSLKGTRIEKGQEIDIDDELAKGLASDLQKVGGAIDPVETEETETVDINELSLAELREKAKELGLSASGSKADLIERIGLAQDAE